MCNEFTTFSFSENVEKTMPKGSPKVMVLDPLGVEGSIYRVFWLDLGRCRSGGQKINKNRPFKHQGPKRDQRSEPPWWIAATDETPGPQGTGRGREIPPPSRGRGIESRVLLNHLSPEGWWDFYCVGSLAGIIKFPVQVVRVTLALILLYTGMSTRAPAKAGPLV